jgi:HK97 family phage prohead protease
MHTELPEVSWARERLLESLEAYRCGLSDAPLLHKWGEGEVRVEGDDLGPMMGFVISTDEVDRHGDVTVPQGWQLESYLRNPVFLWAHDYARPVIGRAASVWKEPHRLLARMEFAPTEFAQEVAFLYRNNYQRGVSVGFRPIAYEERRSEKTGAFLGIRFLEQELLEVSAVPVPANRSALRRSEARDVSRGDYGLPYQPGLGSAPTTELVEAIWPELAARVDNLSKLLGELSEMVASVVTAGGENLSHQGVAEMLEVLREARW